MIDYRYRWVRTESMGTADPTNIFLKERTGWAPVPDSERPEDMLPDHGGLMLFRIPEAAAQEVEKTRLQQATEELGAAEKHYMASPKSGLTPDEARTAPETREEIIARLEDFYSPLIITRYPNHFGGRELVEVNNLRRKIGLPDWELQSLRRSLLKHMETKPGQAFEYKGSGPIWVVWRKNTDDAYKLRQEWRMPNTVRGWVRLWWNDLRGMFRRT